MVDQVDEDVRNLEENEKLSFRVNNIYSRTRKKQFSSNRKKPNSRYIMIRGNDKVLLATSWNVFNSSSSLCFSHKGSNIRLIGFNTTALHRETKATSIYIYRNLSFWI